VGDAADVTKRHVRRVLAEFVAAGYLTREEGGPGRANRFSPEEEPGAGEVDLPRDVGPDPAEAGQPDSNEYYTWNVRVHGVGDAGPPPSTPSPGRLPAPGTAPERATAGDPPPEGD
jgi:hypothetical protein